MTENLNKKLNKKKSKYLPLSKVSQETGYTPEHLNLLCRTGRLKGKKMGRNWFTKREWLNDFILNANTNKKGGGFQIANIQENVQEDGGNLETILSLEKEKKLNEKNDNISDGQVTSLLENLESEKFKAEDKSYEAEKISDQKKVDRKYGEKNKAQFFSRGIYFNFSLGLVVFMLAVLSSVSYLENGILSPLPALQKIKSGALENILGNSGTGVFETDDSNKIKISKREIDLNSNSKVLGEEIKKITPGMEVVAQVEDSEGVQISDGEYQIRFALYNMDRKENDPYPSESDQSVWSETQTVYAKNGLINARLGEGNPMPKFLDPGNNEYYLGVRVGENSEMIPRRKISVDPLSLFAYSAANAQNAETARTLNGVTTGTGAGNIPLISTGGKIDINLLPTGTSGKKLVLANDSRLGGGKIKISGLKYISASGLKLTLSKINLTSDISEILPVINGGTNNNLIGVPGSVSYSDGAKIDYTDQGVAGQVLLSSGSGKPVWGSVGGAISPDSIDFTELADSMTLDGNLTVASSASNYSINFDSGTLFVDTANNRIGIGTINPDEALEVNGDIKLSGDIITDNASQSIGSASDKFYYGYFENLDVENLSIGGVDISGTISNTLTINTDNVTNDLEDSYLAFDRGENGGVPNTPASIQWDSTNDRFVFNYGIETSGLRVNSETVTDWTGNGITISGGALTATLGDSIDISSETNLAVGGTMLQQSGDTISMKEGTLTSGNLCTYVEGTGLVCNTIPGSVGVNFWQRNGTLLSPAAIGDYVGIGTTNPLALFSVGSASQFQVNASGNVTGGTYNGVAISGNGTLSTGAGSYILTVPATGTAALGTGASGQVAYWSGTNTLTSEAYLSVSRGGTGIGTTATDGKLLIGNSSGGYTLANLTAGTGISISNGNGSIIVNALASGVDHNSLTGLQGGAVSEYYHLTSAQYSALHSAVTLDTSAHDYLSISTQQILLGQIDISEDTNLAVGGTILQLSGDTLSLKEGTLTNGRLCTYVEGTGLVCNTDSGTVGHSAVTLMGQNYLTIDGSQVITAGQINIGTTNITGILGLENGGTGIGTTNPGNGTLLIGNGTGYSLANLTAGTGISISNASGSITIASTLGDSIDISSETNLAVGGTMLQQSGDTISMREGTLTNGRICTYDSTNGLVCNTDAGSVGVNYWQRSGTLLSPLNIGDYVGIGTTNPTTALEVNGVITANGGNSTNWNDAYTYRIIGAGGTAPLHLSITENTLSGYIDDATTAAKGIASFNSTNFSVTSGAVNTIQNINSTAAPTFAGLILNGQLTSNVVSGTTPFIITSNTLVSNLNADLLDGHDSSYFQTALTNPVTGTGVSGQVTYWNGTGTISGENYLSLERGGTGIGTTNPGNGTLLIGNGTGYSLANLTAGTGISISNASGSITIATTNITSGTGTQNYLPKWTSATGFGLSSIFDNGAGVGIGTTSPGSYALNVNGSLLTNGSISVNSGNALYFGTFQAASITGTGGAGSYIAFSPSSGEVMRMTDNGGTGTSRVGIGTTNPLALFSVGSSSGFQVDASGNIIAGSWNGSDIDISSYTNLAVGGTILQLSGDTLSLKEGTLTNGRLCTYVEGTGLVCNTDSGTVGHSAVTLMGQNYLTIDGSQVITAGQINIGTTNITGILGLENGGTGIGTTNPGNGTLLIGNGTGYSLANLTAGTGISISNASGSITIASTLGDSIDISSETNLAVGGTMLQQSGDTISMREGTLTNGNLCTYVEGTGLVCNTIPGSVGVNYWQRSGTLLSPLNIGDYVGIGTTNPLALFSVGSSSGFQVDASGNIIAGSWNGSDIDISSYTNLAVGGTLLQISGDTLSIKEGTLTNGRLCTYDSTNGLVCNTDSGTVGHSAVTLAGQGYLTIDGSQVITAGQINIGSTQVTGILGLENGGTGIGTTNPANGTLLIGNGTGYTLATLTQGSGISISNASGSITIATSGITSGTGVQNYIPRWTSSTGFGLSSIYDNGTGVGIGTTNPLNSFHVNKSVTTLGSPTSVASFGVYYTDGFNDGDGAQIAFRGGDEASNNNYLGRVGAVRNGADNEGSLVFKAGTDGNEEFMRIKNNGYLGIGTTNPLALLSVGSTSQFQVNASGNVTGGTYNGVTISGNGTLATGAGSYTLTVPATGTAALGTGVSGQVAYWTGTNSLSSEAYLSVSRGGTGIGTTAADGRLLIGNSSGGYTLANLTAGTGVSISNASGSITINATGGTSMWSDAGSYIYPNNYTNLAITDSGYVGIGTTNPTGIFQIGIGATPPFYVSTGGNVGIGTTNPIYALDVNAGMRAWGLRLKGSSLTFANSSDSGKASISLSGDDLVFNVPMTAGNERFFIKSSSGYVGIGTTNPLALFSVGSTSQFQINSSGTVTSGTWNGTDIDISDYTNLAVGGTLLQISGDTLSIKEGTLNNGYLCTYVEGTGIVCNTSSGSVGHVPVTLVGQNYLTIDGSQVITAGQIGLGTTNVTGILGLENGGTGIGTTNPANGTLLIGNGTGYTLATLTQGSGIGITSASGAITIHNTDPGSSQYIFKNIAIGLTTIQTDTNSDTLTLSAGSNVTLTADEATDTITISTTGISSGTGTQNYVPKWTSATGFGLSSIYDNGTGVGIGTTNPGGIFQIGIGQTTPLFVSTVGRVGIGTTNPGSKLYVAGDSIFDYTGATNTTALTAIVSNNSTAVSAISALTISNTNSTANTINSLNFKHANVSSTLVDAAAIQASLSGTTAGAENGFLRFATMKAGTLTEQMRIDSNGYVGIGTTNPLALLSVGSTSQFQVNASGNVTGGTYNGVTISGNGTLSTGSGSYTLTVPATGTAALGTGVANAIAYWSTTNTLTSEQYLNVERGGTGIGTTAQAGQLLIGNGTGYSLATITAGSGIGITNAAGSITITANGTYMPSGSYNGQTIRYNGSSWLADGNLYNDGTNVGIGTTNPLAKLEVNGNIRITTAGLLQFGDTDNYIGGNSSTDNVYIGTNGLYRLLVNGSGNVGIGMTSPLALLDVGSTAPTFRLTDTDGATFLMTNNANKVIMSGIGGTASQLLTLDLGNGRVGVGTTSPNYLLTVSGSVSDYASYIYNGSTVPTAAGLYIRGDGAGNLLTLNYAGSDIFTVNSAQSTFSNPVSFAGTGDISVANDIVMTHATAGNILFQGPGYIRTDSVWQNLDLTLSAANTGEIILDDEIQITGSRLHVDGITGNVGIGTTNPLALFSVGASSQFQVNASGNVTGGTYNGVTISGNGTLATGSGSYTLTVPATGTSALGTGANGQVAYWTGTNSLSSEAYLSVSRGGVGIDGSTAPNGTLLIGNGTGYTLANLTAGTGVSISNGAGTITINATSTGSGSGVVNSGNAGFFSYYLTSGTAVSGQNLLFTDGSSVGIGTTNPLALFSVGSSSQFQVDASGNVNGGTYNGNTITAGTGTITLNSNVLTLNASSTLNQDLETSDSPTFAGLTLSGMSQGSIIYAGVGGLLSQDNANFFYDGGNHRLGIGTTAPGAMIDIFGTNNALRLSYDASNYVSLSSNANGELVMSGSSSDGSSVILGTGNAEDTSVIFDGNAQDYYFGLDDTNDTLNIGLGQTIGLASYITINSSGNVGIGTTNPTYLLDVNGSFRSGTTAPVFESYTLTIPTTGTVALGSGIANQVAYWSTANTLSGENYLSVSRGGTGIGTTAQAGQLLIGNSSGGYNLNTLTAGTGVSISNASGSITINATGTFMPAGAYNGQTLRYNGSSWLANDVIYNDGTNVGIGTTNPLGIFQIGIGATTPIFVSAATGNVGIGTTNTTQTLTVNGYVQIVGYGQYRFGTGGAAVGGNDDLQLVTNYNTRMNIDSSGNIGIGSSASTTPTLFVSSGGNVGISTTNPYGLLSVGSGSLFQVNNSGFIGLGGTTPLFSIGVDSTDSNKFKIYSGSDITGTSQFSIDSNGVTSIANLEMGELAFAENSGMISWVDMSVTSAAPDNTVESYTAMLDGNPMLTIYGLSDGAGGVDNLGVGISATTPAGLFDVAGKFVVLSGGNVGIGTTNPTQKLAVYGTGGGAAGILLNDATPGTTTTTLYNSGGALYWGTTNLTGGGALPGGTYNGQTLRWNGSAWVANGTLYNDGTSVGIGTTAPGSYALYIAGGDVNLQEGRSYRLNSTSMITDSYTGGQTHYKFGLSTIGSYIDFPDDGTVNVLTNNLSRMFINSSGNIGIGTTNPLGLFQIGIGQTTPLFVSSTTGNVGIGTTNPGSALDVNGRISASSDVLVAGNAMIAQFGLYNGSVSNAGFAFSGTGTNADLLLRTNSIGTAMIVKNSGYVGIGTTSPYSLFSVGASSQFQVSSTGIIGLGGTTPLFTMGIDTTDSNKFKIYSGSDITGTSEFTISTEGVTSIANLEMGELSFPDDAGAVTWIDMAVTSTSPDNTIERYTAMLDGNSMLTIYGLSDGSGGVDNLGVGISASVPAGLFDVGGKFVVLSGGNVGIGTTNPTQKLVVYGTGGGAAGIYLNDAAPSSTTTTLYNSGGALYWGTTNLTGGGALPGGTYNGQTLRWNGSAWTANGTIYNDGTNVGIGTTASLAQLTVGGSIFPSADDAYDLGDNTHRFRDLYLGADSLHIGSSTSDEYTLSYDTNNDYLAFNFNGSGDPEIVMNSSGYLGIGITNPTGLFQIGIGTTTPLFVSTDGKVGIGTTNPLGLFQVGIGATTPFFISAGGNVGIGTTNPLAFLDVNGVGAHSLGAVGAPSFAFRTDLNTGMWSSGSDTINFSTGGAERMRISNAGYIGIGTTAPASMLNIFGTSNALRLSYNTTNYATLSANSNGELVIGGSSSSGPSIVMGSGLAENIYLLFDGNYSATEEFSYLGFNSANNSIQAGLGQDVGTNAYITLLLSSGNVGIGNTNPTGIFQVGIGATTPFFISAGGNVGIGTTNPGSMLEVSGVESYKSKITVASNYNGYDNPIIDFYKTRNYGALQNWDSLGQFTFSGLNSTSTYKQFAYFDAVAEDVTNGAENGLFFFNIMKNGTSVNALEFGSSKTEFNKDNVDIDLQFNSDIADGALFMDGSNGYIGIGTTSPTSRLLMEDWSHSIASADYTSAVLKSSFTGTLGADHSGTGLEIDAFNSAVPNGHSLEVVGSKSQAFNLDGYTSSSISGAIGAAYGAHTSGSVDISYGVKGFAAQTGSGGTTTTAIGVFGQVAQTAGTVINGYGGYFSGAGSNPIGVYATNGTNDAYLGYAGFGLYTASKGYFGGNVGIGTTNPGAMLEILGSSNGLRLAYDTSNYATLSSDNSGNFTIATSNTTDSAMTLGNSSATNISLLFDSNATDYYIARNNSNSNLEIGRGLIAGTNPGIMMDSNGNVGIGGTAVSAKPSMYFLANGDIGIGTTDVSYMLDIKGTDSDGIYVGGHGLGGSGVRITSNEVAKVGAGASNLTINSSAGFLGGMVLIQTSGGNVGIGTTNATATLEVNGNIKANYSASTTYYASVTGTSGGTLSYYSSDERLKENIEYLGSGLDVVRQLKPATYNIKADGTYASGFIAQDTLGLVPGAATLMPDGYYAFNINGVVAYTTKAVQELDQRTLFIESKYASSSSPAMFVSASGNTGIGNTNPNYKFQVGSAGDGSEAIANAWLTFSDARYKKNIEEINGAVNLLGQIRGVTYDWKGNGQSTYGFIAQEIETVIPELVYTDKNGYKSVDYSKFAPILVSAVNEQQTQIDEISDSQLQISNQFGTYNEEIAKLGDENISVNDKINIIGDTLSSQNEILAQLQDESMNLTNTSADHEKRLKAIEDQMKTLEEMNQSIIDFAKVFSPELVVYKDSDGGINLGTGKLEADGVVAGAFTVKVVDPEKKTLGTEILESVKIDENGDGIDDSNFSIDGKSVIVKTKAVNENSKVFVTAKTTLDRPLAVTEIISGVGFKVETKDAVSGNVEFDWWIVEEK